jgi:hypothetical protein
MNLIKSIFTLLIILLRIFVTIKVMYLLILYLSNDKVEMSRDFYLLLGYMIFEIYVNNVLFKTDDVDIYNKEE